MVATAAAPVNMVMLVVREGLPVPLLVALPVALPEEPGALLDLALPVDDAVIVEFRALEDAMKPLQRPLLQELKAHCESRVQAALKFPHAAMRPALLAQHCAPSAHWLGFTKGLHWAPRGSDPGAAVTVDEGAGLNPPVGVLVIVGEAEGVDEDRKPLQRPWLQVLKAHCWLLVQAAWKFPQRGCNIEFVA